MEENKKETGSFNNIKIILKNYNIIKPLDLKIKKEINSHITGSFKALVEEGDIVENITENEEVKIVQIKEDPKNPDKPKEEILFIGFAGEISLAYETKDNGYYIEVKFVSYTMQLDFKKNERSFQDKNNLYTQIFDQIIKQENEGDYILNLDEEIDKKQNKTIIQYEETDWEFIKRLANNLETYIIPESKSDKARLFIGNPKIDENKIETNNYKTIINVDKNIIHKSNGINMHDSAYVSHEIESFKNFDLGETITFQNQKFIITKVISEMQKELFVHKYTLEQEMSLKPIKEYNKKIGGISIEGKIIKIENDTVKLHLSIDEKQDEATANPYRFSTMYTGKGNTGYHFMPEIGDTVYLYFPSQEEDDAFIRGIKHSKALEEHFNQKRENPENKYISNNEGKELAMTNEGIKWTSKEDTVYLDINNSSGIKSQTSSDTNIFGGFVKFYGKNINFKAEENIIIYCEDSSILMEDDTHLNGNFVIEKEVKDEECEEDE